MIQEQKKTHEDITDAKVPDPINLPDIGGPYLVVRPVEVKATSKSGLILLPEQTREDIKFLCNVARVLSIGPYAFKSKELDSGSWFQNGDVKVGQYVVYGRFAGQNINYMGVNLKMIKDTDIRLRVKDPSTLDTFVNIERS